MGDKGRFEIPAAWTALLYNGDTVGKYRTVWMTKLTYPNGKGGLSDYILCSTIQHDVEDITCQLFDGIPGMILQLQMSRNETADKFGVANSNTVIPTWFETKTAKVNAAMPSGIQSGADAKESSSATATSASTASASAAAHTF